MCAEYRCLIAFEEKFAKTYDSQQPGRSADERADLRVCHNGTDFVMFTGHFSDSSTALVRLHANEMTFDIYDTLVLLDPN